MRYFIFILLSLLCLELGAQKCLQMEKYGSAKRQRLYIGDEITFKLKNDEHGWYRRFISDFDVNGGYVVFGAQRIHIDSIASIQLEKHNGMKFLGTVIQLGGANTILFSIGYPLAQGRDPEWVGVAWGAGFLGLGTLIKQFDRNKQFKVGKRKWLRLLDLNMSPPPLESRS